MSHRWTAPLGTVGRATLDFSAAFGRFGGFATSAARSTPDVATWGRLLVVQMALLGVASLPIALFIAAFTGIVLALQASYTFTGAVPLYFVGVLVEKTMILELGPVLTGLALAGVHAGRTYAAGSAPVLRARGKARRGAAGRADPVARTGHLKRRRERR
jgi:ABC-type transporter Mla maintaining outer membrane lipid asymmetry permease subunit MlaE